MCNTATHTIHYCSQCGRDNGLDYCTSHCSEHIPQDVKVGRFTELEFIAELKRCNALSMLDAAKDAILESLLESGEDKAKAKEYVADLIAKHID